MIYLFVPCYNESSRIQLDHFAKVASQDLHIIFCDDGSTDSTADKISNFINESKTSFLSLFQSPKNVGKAEVIRQGYLTLRSKRQVLPSDWVGYWDADLATPLYEVSNMLKFNEALYNGQAEAIWGSRVYRLGSRIVRSPLRHYLGRLFATVISVMLKVESYDSQCGAKLFSGKVAPLAFDQPFISRWVFDVEILLRLEKTMVIEYPLLEWKDVPGSKIKVFNEAGRIWKDIVKIRDKYRRGQS